MSSREIVFDIETQNTFEDIGEFKPQNLRVSCVGVYFYKNDTYRAYMEEELDELEQELAQCSLLIGFNHLRFDLPVLEPYFRNLKIKSIPSLDILETIRKIAGHRVSLNSVAQATLNSKKSGHGLQAIKDWEQYEGEQEKIWPEFFQMRKAYWQKLLEERTMPEKTLSTWRKHCEENAKPDFTNFGRLKNLTSWKKLEQYCLDDVRITKDIYEYGRTHQEIFFTAKDPKFKSRVSVAWNQQSQPQSKQMGLF